MAMEENNGSSKEEQLYMLELLVDRLNLCPDKMREIGKDRLCVGIKFIDFPPFEIDQDEFASARRTSDEQQKTRSSCREENDEGDSGNEEDFTVVDFSAGKSCLFAKQPRELVRAMQSRPLKVVVYRVSDQRVCGVAAAAAAAASGHDLICETLIPLSGCLCDQVAMAMNDSDHLPKPYTLKNAYAVIDSHGRPSGTISVFLRLSCFGKSIVTHFSFQEKSFLFKSSRLGDEFRCSRVPPPPAECPPKNEARGKRKGVVSSDEERKENEPPASMEPLPEPRDVIGLAPACRELMKRDGLPANVRPPLRLPRAAPRLGINDPGFETLTSAEKLNDGQYRGLVYRAYPNESTCSCGSAEGRTKLPSELLPPCAGSGCTGVCCSRIRTPCLTELANGSERGSTGCVRFGGRGQLVENNGHGGETRMRGGGGGSDDPLLRGYHQPRSSHCNGEGGTITRSDETTPRNACRTRLDGDDSTPGCCFPGSEESGGVTERKNDAVCTKKPCLGVDCLIRTFNETQEFVDSLGRVPGLAGLGLPDPSESPYFGREKEPSSDIAAPRKSPFFSAQQQQQQQLTNPNPQCGGPSNAQASRQPVISGNSAGMSISAHPPSTMFFPMAIPGRTGVVREAIPTLPEPGSVLAARARKKEERVDKIELNSLATLEGDSGPCGEPKCRSRRKRGLSNDASNAEGGDGQTRRSSRSGPHVGSPIGGPSKLEHDGSSDRGHKYQQRHKAGYPSPEGDRNASHRSPLRSTQRRIARFVYTAGTTYPGINYGHKVCTDSRLRVPSNMGWLWNLGTTVGRLKPRPGWKPGAISHHLTELFKEARQKSSVEGRPRSAPSRGKRGKVQRTKSYMSMKKAQGLKKKEEEEETVEPPPTLHIHRKDGIYYVTMYPIKQETMEVPKLEEPMKPLQFKIARNKDDAPSVASSSTASDMEIEFSPPAAVNRYRKKPNVIHVDTQVKQQEILDAFKPPGGKKSEGKKGKKGKK